jgi:hypothetical protein
VADSSTRLDTVTVALLDPVNLAAATSPTNDSERLLFRNLFDTPLRLDCEGSIRPGLAQSWTHDVSGRGWVLTLREGATFPAGMPMPAWALVSPRTLLATYSASAKAFRIDSAVELDDRRLLVLMRDRVGSLEPRFLADPALVVIDGLASDTGSGEGSLTMLRDNLPVIDFRFPFVRDVRDALDRDVDLVVTRDPALVDYVSNRTEFVTSPLPWSRTYVLAHPDGLPEKLTAGLNTAAVRASLAKDAVRASARPAEPPYWWGDLQSCSLAPPTRQLNAAASRVIYPKDDAVARGLAERVVALASASTGLRALGVEAAQFSRAVRDGTERAYVIGLPRQSLAPCRDASMLPPGARFLPLIETRAYAIVRKGVPPLTVEWDGTPRIVGP